MNPSTLKRRLRDFGLSRRSVDVSDHEVRDRTKGNIWSRQTSWLQSSVALAKIESSHPCAKRKGCQYSSWAKSSWNKREKSDAEGYSIKILWLEVERSNNRPKVPSMCKRKCWLSTPWENWSWHQKWNFGSVYSYFRQEGKGLADLCTFLIPPAGRSERKIHWCSFLNSQNLSFAFIIIL